MEIRLARAEDMPGILEISNWAAEHTAANFATQPETLESWQSCFDATHEMHPWFVAVGDDGSIIGFAKAAPYQGRCAYTYTAEITVYVHPDHHEQGIGKALYGRLIPTLKAQGYRSVTGAIALPNAASLRLHERFGLRCAGILERVGWKFDKWHDVGYWQGQLTDDHAEPTEIKPVREVVEGVGLEA
jgi:phosphinothricin acetyltransferase